MKFLWCDIESSGLDPNKDTILEVAVGVADAATPFALTEVQSWVIGFGAPSGELGSSESHLGDRLRSIRAAADAKVQAMHETNGLWEACAKSTTTLAEVEDVLVTLVVQEDEDFRHEWIYASAGKTGEILEPNAYCRICNLTPEQGPCEKGARQKKTKVAGFSPRFDRDFLCAQMPKLREHLNYQTFDVTTLKTYAELMGMSRLDAQKNPAHRALDDMKQSFVHFNVVHRWLGQRALYPASKARYCP